MYMVVKTGACAHTQEEWKVQNKKARDTTRHSRLLSVSPEHTTSIQHNTAPSR